MMVELVPCRAAGPLLGRAHQSHVSRLQQGSRSSYFRFRLSALTVLASQLSTREQLGPCARSANSLESPALLFRVQQVSSPTSRDGTVQLHPPCSIRPITEAAHPAGCSCTDSNKVWAGCDPRNTGSSSIRPHQRPAIFPDSRSCQASGSDHQPHAAGPKAPSPPETVSYQGYFGLHDSVPTLADRKQWMTISSGSDMFVATQSMGRSIRKVLRVGQR